MTQKKDPSELKKPGRKRGQKDYDVNDKGTALAVLDFFDGNIDKTARAIGVNRLTLMKFRDELELDPDAPTAAIRNAQNASAHSVLIQLLETLSVFVIMKAQTATFRELYYITGIVSDKLQALEAVRAKLPPLPEKPVKESESPTLPETPAPEADPVFAREKEHWEDVVKTIITEARNEGKEISREDAISNLVESRPEAAMYFEEVFRDRVM